MRYSRYTSGGYDVATLGKIRYSTLRTRWLPRPEMRTIFWDAVGVGLLLIDFMPHKVTATIGFYYTDLGPTSQNACCN